MAILHHNIEPAYLRRMNARYIAIEGNIGAGKTTLATKLAEHFKARLILEEFDTNPFLPGFYRDKDRYALAVELHFITERYLQLRRELVENRVENQPVVSDYTFMKSHLFARNNLNEQEFRLFQTIEQISDTQLPMPDVVLYLHAPSDVLLQRIKIRARSYEQQIQQEYLDELEQAYQTYLSQISAPVIRLDTSKIDFTRPDHWKQLLQTIAPAKKAPK